MVRSNRLTFVFWQQPHWVRVGARQKCGLTGTVYCPSLPGSSLSRAYAYPIHEMRPGRLRGCRGPQQRVSSPAKYKSSAHCPAIGRAEHCRTRNKQRQGNCGQLLITLLAVRALAMTSACTEDMQVGTGGPLLNYSMPPKFNSSVINAAQVQ